MSWSVDAVGRPEKIAGHIETANAGLSGISKDEYEAAKPHLIALVKENFGSDYIVRFKASGSSGMSPQPNRSCAVSIETIYGKILV